MTVLLALPVFGKSPSKQVCADLTLPKPFKEVVSEQIQTNALIQLDIKPDHLEILVALPFHHRDPFDRLLVAQAKGEALAIVSIDSALDAYEVERLW